MSDAQDTAAQVVARAVEDVWNTGDVAQLDHLLSDDYVRHGRSGDTSCEALKQSILLARNAFPDIVTTVEHMVHQGDLVATHWRTVGTHLGPFYDLPITGKAVQITGMTFSRLVGNRIVEEWESWDQSDLFASLGVVNLWES